MNVKHNSRSFIADENGEYTSLGAIATKVVVSSDGKSIDGTLTMSDETNQINYYFSVYNVTAEELESEKNRLNVIVDELIAFRDKLFEAYTDLQCTENLKKSE